MDYKNALKCFNRALEIAPDNKTFQENRQNVLKLGEEKINRDWEPPSEDKIKHFAELRYAFDWDQGYEIENMVSFTIKCAGEYGGNFMANSIILMRLLWMNGEI